PGTTHRRPGAWYPLSQGMPRSVTEVPMPFLLPVVPLLFLWADDAAVSLTKVPKSVMHALQKEYPAAKPIAAAKGTKNGDTRYTITVRHEERTVRVSFTSRGKLMETCAELTAGELPKAVTLSLQKQYPGAAVGRVLETIAIADGHRRSFTVTLKTADNKSL